MDRRGFLSACGAAALAGCNALGADATDPPFAWQFDNGAPLRALSVSETGRVYLTGLAPGGAGGRLVELEAGSGEPTQLLRVESAADMSVLAAVDAVYLWIAPLGARTGVVLVTDTDGGRLWRAQSLFGLPTVADGLAYLRGRRAVRALEARTGDQWWRLPLDEPPLSRARHLTAVDDWHRLFLSGPDGVASVDIAGARRWTVEREARTTVPLAVGETTAYVGDNPLEGDPTVSAHAPAGRTRWRATVPGDVVAPMPSPQGAYATAWTDDDPVLWALRPGGTSWRVEGLGVGAVVRGGVAGVGDRGVVVLSADGTERWRFDPPAGQSPSIWTDGDGLLVVVGSVATALTRTGDVRWQYDAGAPVEDVVVAGGRVYLLTDRRVHAIG